MTRDVVSRDMTCDVVSRDMTYKAHMCEDATSHHCDHCGPETLGTPLIISVNATAREILLHHGTRHLFLLHLLIAFFLLHLIASWDATSRTKHTCVIISHIQMSYVTRMKKQSQPYELVMSHI